MNASARLAVALLAALALWFPSLSACLRGDVGLPDAALRFLAAYIVARIGVGILARLHETYAVEAARRAAEPDHAPGS